ncbi:MAG: bifunctional heptose 7-phosphate kinase/heptose 1-phosphate adenyltransferase [Pyrinomonadaceae bacterium]
MASLPKTLQENFSDKNIAIIGDVVADQFLCGTIERVSREAPVFIVRHDHTKTVGGGAANAAANVASLGGTASIVGLVGEDKNGNDLLNVLKAANVNCDSVVISPDFSTTTKVRVLAAQAPAKRKQVIRIDYENRQKIHDDVQAKLLESTAQTCLTADAIIVSDYDYGVANADIFEICKEIAKERSIPLLIDSRTRLEEFAGVTAATPNEEEAEQILGKNFTKSDCEQLRKTLNLEMLLVTRGSKGMLLIEKGKLPFKMGVVGSNEPVDVTGAGDTVIAAFSLALASGLSFADAAEIANHAGGIVVMKEGTACVTFEELAASLDKFPLSDSTQAVGE